MYETGERLIGYMMALATGFVICLWTTDASASIVNDPVALELKLEEMRVAREAKHDAKEAYWADYRRNQESYQDVRCSVVYTSKGNYRKCKTVTNYRYSGALQYPN